MSAYNKEADRGCAGLQDGRVGLSLGAVQELHGEAKDYP